MKKDLRVKIPKCFKKELEKRFDIRRARKEGGDWSIHTECPLCLHYTNDECGGCPLVRFKDKNSASKGCIVWIREVLGEELYFEVDNGQEVWWNDIFNKEAREGIKKFKRRARRLIEWV